MRPLSVHCAGDSQRLPSETPGLAVPPASGSHARAQILLSSRAQLLAGQVVARGVTLRSGGPCASHPLPLSCPSDGQ